MPDVEREISRWCDDQIGLWESNSDDGIALEKIQQDLCRSNPTVSLLSIEGSSVRVSNTHDHIHSAILNRTHLYAEFLAQVLRECGPIEGSITLALDVSDEPENSVDIPVFSFQKQSGHRNILLPDVDFFYHDYYKSLTYHDTQSYLEKSISAIFAGSSTGGGEISLDKIAAGLVPRIDSALFFFGNQLVDFRLPNLVQMDSQKTTDWLRAKGFGVGAVTWPEQFGRRFILSLDGNGAACSRLFVGLRSNSVVMKYDSSSELFYHKSLKPWVHFIPIATNSDVLTHLQTELDHPGSFEQIALDSREFCNEFLNVDVLRRYTHALLSRYSSIFNRHPASMVSTEVDTGWHSPVDASLPLPRKSIVASSIPDHRGMDYRHVVQNIHSWLTPKTYLEVGVEQGETFKLSNCMSIGVDVAFKFTAPDLLQRLTDRPMSALYRMGSDSFFKSFDPVKIAGAPIDLAFLDGMHQCEYLLRDFINTERSCNPNSIILLHDCCPLEAPMAAREPGQPAIEKHREGWWTGDVWRTALALKRFRKDLKMVTLDAFPTGLVCITNLNPASTYLFDEYFTIVDQMRSWDLSEIGPDTLMAELGTVSTDTVGTPEKMQATLRNQ